MSGKENKEVFKLRFLLNTQRSLEVDLRDLGRQRKPGIPILTPSISLLTIMITLNIPEWFILLLEDCIGQSAHC